MDTVKKDVEGIKSEINTIKESIDMMKNLMLKTREEANLVKYNILKEKVVEHSIAMNLLLHLLLKDEGKEKVFDDKVKELKCQLYEEMVKEIEEEKAKKRAEALNT